MIKTIFIFILVLLFFQDVKAQKDILQNAQAQKDTLLYFMKNNDRFVLDKKDADYFLFIMPPDTSTGQVLYPIFEYYPNGKPKLMTMSLTKKFYPNKFEGACVDFYSNGKRKSVTNYANGYLTGDMTLYYPNGKLYAAEQVDDNKMDDFHLKLIECRDSTGNVLAENGNGKWLRFDGSVKNVIEEGEVKDSLEEGEWQQTYYKSPQYAYMYNQAYVTVYHKGVAVSTTDPYRPIGGEIFAAVEIEPTFDIGGMNFGDFLGQNISYPVHARENNIQGKVIVQFIVEKDGSVSNVKAVRSSDQSLADEAIRVVKLSKWNPGMQNGRPVRCYFTVPISFTISHD